MGGSSSLEKIKLSNASIALNGKNALVFGGTAGIGRALAIRLAQGGANVTIVGRNETAGKTIVEEMSKVELVGAAAANTASSSSSSSSSSRPTHEFVKGDLMLMKNCRKIATDYTKAHSRLDYVVFCQTIATTQGRTPTAEGIDQKLSLNIYSRVFLLEELMPLLNSTATSPEPSELGDAANKDASDVRILSVLSAGVHAAYPKWKEDTHLSNDNYSLKNAADLAGFYNDLCLDDLSRKHKNVTFAHAAPGFVDTNWGTEMPLPLKGAIRVMQACGGRSASDCAEYMIQGLISPDLKGGLQLMSQYGEKQPKTDIHDDEKVTYVSDAIRAELARAVAVAEETSPATAATAEEPK